MISPKFNLVGVVEIPTYLNSAGGLNLGKRFLGKRFLGKWFLGKLKEPVFKITRYKRTSVAITTFKITF